MLFRDQSRYVNDSDLDQVPNNTDAIVNENVVDEVVNAAEPQQGGVPVESGWCCAHLLFFLNQIEVLITHILSKACLSLEFLILIKNLAYTLESYYFLLLVKKDCILVLVVLQSAH